MSEFHDLDRRVVVLEQIAGNLDRPFDAIDRRFDSLERRFDAIDRRFDTIDRRIDAYFRRLLGTFLGGGGAMLAIIAHGCHWL